MIRLSGRASRVTCWIMGIEGGVCDEPRCVGARIRHAVLEVKGMLLAKARAMFEWPYGCHTGVSTECWRLSAAVTSLLDSGMATVRIAESRNISPRRHKTPAVRPLITATVVLPPEYHNRVAIERASESAALRVEALFVLAASMSMMTMSQRAGASRTQR